MKRILFYITVLFILSVFGYAVAGPAWYSPGSSTGSVTGLTAANNVAITGGNVTGLTNLGAANATLTGANVTTLNAVTPTFTGVLGANVINASGTLTAVPSATSPIMFGNTTPVISVTGATFPTATKTQISKASAFTDCAVGDLIIITGGSTGGTATLGQYRLTTKTSNDLVVVDRNIHASGTDITDGAFTVYKDVVTVSPTDATNGQMITGWSHQNKPLQIGGSTLKTTSRALAGTGVLISDNIEVDGSIYLDSYSYISGETLFTLATSKYHSIRHGPDDGFHFSLNMDDGYGNGNFILTAYANRGQDHDHETLSTNPTLFIHSSTDPDSNNTQWLSFTHDTVDGVIDTGTGLVKIKEDFANSSETANSGGGFARRIAEATSGALSGATGTIAVNVPTGARILGVQLRVDTAVTFSGTDTTWKAVYVNTPTTAICSTQAAAKSTKYSALHAAYEITTGTVTITVSSDGSDTFTGGVIRAIVYYEDTIAMSDAP